MTDFTSNWVCNSNRFFTCIATWGQENVHSDKETHNMLLWTMWVFGFKLLYIMLMPYQWFKNKWILPSNIPYKMIWAEEDAVLLD